MNCSKVKRKFQLGSIVNKMIQAPIGLSSFYTYLAYLCSVAFDLISSLNGSGSRTTACDPQLMIQSLTAFCLPCPRHRLIRARHFGTVKNLHKILDSTKLCHDNNKMDLFDKISYRHIDIQSICGFLRRLQIIDPDVRSLEDCTRYFKLSRSAAHDALEDSVLALEVYKNLLKISRSAYRFDMAVIR